MGQPNLSGETKFSRVNGHDHKQDWKPYKLEAQSDQYTCYNKTHHREARAPPLFETDGNLRETSSRLQRQDTDFIGFTGREISVLRDPTLSYPMSNMPRW